MTDQITDVNVAEPVDSAREAAREERRARKRSKRVRTALAIVLALLVLLLLVLSVFVVKLMTPIGAPKPGDLTEGMEWVRSIYGWGKQENQHLLGPTDVAVGPDGVIWANDPQRFELVGFNPDGSYRTIVHQGPGYMMPQAFTVSAENEIYIADFQNHKIRVFSPDNKELRSWPSTLPMEVAVRGDRVVVGQRDHVVVYDKRGRVVNSWATRGKADDQVDVVRGIAIGPDDTVYLSDTENHRVKAYSQDGKMKWVYPDAAQIKKWDAQSKTARKPKKPYQIPAGMTFDGAGRLVLVDPFEFQILIVDPKTGKPTARYGEPGERDGKFAYPTSISYDPVRDWFAVADTANNRVQVVRIVGSGRNPLSAIARASVGPVWICSIPLILLLIAVAIMVSRRRREKREAAASSGVDAPEQPAEVREERVDEGPEDS